MKLLSLTISLLFIQSFLFAQEVTHKDSIQLEKVESLIDIGKHEQALNILNEIKKNCKNNFFAVKAEILTARILHENGKRLEAIDELNNILQLSVLNKNPEIKADTYLVLAECYFGMNRLEKFKKISDTVLQLTRKYQIKPHYKFRAFTNFIRYYAYQAQIQNGKPYLDSANNLYKNAKKEEILKYKPLIYFTGLINFDRNYDRVIIFDHVNNAIKLLKVKKTFTEKYDQVNLWRAIGNWLMDSASSTKPKSNLKKALSSTLLAFDNAQSILKNYYPSNQIDLVFLNNLKGLLYFRFGLYNSSVKQFSLSESILLKNKIPIESFTYTYMNTYEWKLGVLDSVYKGENLIKRKEHALLQFEQIAPYWDQWMEINKNQTLQFFRNFYVNNAYEFIVHICNDLYHSKHDAKYIEIAWQAQEKAKYINLKNELISRYNINSNSSILSLKAIQKLLLPNQSIISFSDIHTYIQSTYAIVITADTTAIFRFKLNVYDKIYGSYNLLLNDFSYFKKLYFSSYNILFKPILPFLNNKINQLAIFPSTYSSKVKLDMLISDTSGYNTFSSLPFIFKKYKITYDFSFQVARLRKTIKNSDTQNSNSLQAYIPDYINTEYYQLPFFKEASHYLKDRYQFKVYDQKRATLLNYKTNAGKAAILNIMGHSLTNPSSTETLSIAMDSLKDGDLKFLTPIEIIKTPLYADLTILSFCESGLGDDMVTNSYLNLVYWFTYAGSKSCLYSYWKLDDRSTAFILERFFHYLSLGMIKSSALTNAKNDYLAQTKTEEERNLVYWGGLALIGDDSPILITENKRTDYWYVTLFVIPLLFYFYKVRNKIKLPRKLP